MNLREFGSHRETKEQDLEQVAAQIQPLPDNVVPSEQFLAQMRLRLLRLSAQGKRPTPRQAA